MTTANLINTLQSNMKTFSLTLPNGATLTGRSHLPAPPADGSPATTRALLVGLHGGTYSSLYFDVDANHTAATASDYLSIPFVAIDRPGYEGSTPYDSAPEALTYTTDFGNWLHRFILPAVWTEFGPPNGCTALVLLAHSLGVPGAIIAAANHSQETPAQRKYPLAGLVGSGWGSQSIPPDPANNLHDIATHERMLLPPGTAHPSVYSHTARLLRQMPPEEVGSLATVWLPRWRAEWAPNVRIPLMLAVVEQDPFWLGTDEHLRDWMAAFPNSPRVDGTFLPGAAHNIEMSLWSKGWYARCFGFAYECAVHLARARETATAGEL